MKQTELCPICYSELHIQLCSPCDDCGAVHSEINRQPYTIYEVYQGLRLTLCHYCEVDFGSYKSEYFGLENEKRIGFEQFNFVKQVDSPQSTRCKCCSECGKKIKFLNFVAEVRKLKNKGVE